jgi:hypothetical protein
MHFENISMLFYKLNCYLNGKKVLQLANDGNDSLAVIIDKINDYLLSNEPKLDNLHEDKFYTFRLYDGSGQNMYAKGIYSTYYKHVDLHVCHKMFERFFVCGRKYTLLLSEVVDPIFLITTHTENGSSPLSYMHGRKDFMDWIHTYRLHIDCITLNQHKFTAINVEEIQNKIDHKLNYVVVKIK